MSYATEYRRSIDDPEGFWRDLKSRYDLLKGERDRPLLPPRDLYVPVDRAHAKLRYRSEAVPTRIHLQEGGFRLELDQPAYGIAPGQAAVLYDGSRLLGGGWIAETEAAGKSLMYAAAA